MGGVPVTDAVAKFITAPSQLNVVLGIADLEREFPDHNRATLQRAMLSLAEPLGVEVVIHGRSWIVRGPEYASGLRTGSVVDSAAREARRTEPKPLSVIQQANAARPVATPVAPPASAEVFEFVGTTETGKLLRDESGKLWTAKPLK